MDIFAVLILIVLVIFIVTTNTKLKRLQDTVNGIDQKFNRLERTLKQDVETSQKPISQTLADKNVAAPTVLKPEIKQPEVKPEEIRPVIKEELKVEDKQVITSKSTAAKPEIEKIQVSEVIEGRRAVTDKKPIAPQKKSWFEKFRENNPDLEKFVGENLINKIGILILVLGISFFVKYAIDRDWINEPARVGIGILAGALVMMVAHRLKKNYAAFSSVLVAGAISIFYFTIAIAFHDYQLFSQTVAFAIMVVITAFSAFVSVAYNRQELAVLSLIGGFAVPFMVSTGEGNYMVLFTYITILNIGILAIAYFRKWNIVSILSFLFTSILFVSWFVKEMFENTEFPHKGAFAFATLFYFMFSVLIVLNNVRNNGKFSIWEYGIIIANTFVYFGLGLSIINDLDLPLKGAFTLSLAAYNLIYGFVLYRKFGIDKKAVYLLIGLVLTFVTLTIPIQFEGNYITLFWAAEAVLLLWLSQKSKINLFKIGALIVQFLAIISLFIDWVKYYLDNDDDLTLVFNPIFITGLVVVASLVGAYFLLKKKPETTQDSKAHIFIKLHRIVVTVAALVIGYFVGIFEVGYQADVYYRNNYSEIAFPVAYHFVYSTALVYFGLKSKTVVLQQLASCFAFFNILLYVGWFHLLPSGEALHNIADKTDSDIAFYLHYIVLMCMAYFMFVLIKQVVGKPSMPIFKFKAVLWVLVFLCVFILSNELMVHFVYSVEPESVYKIIGEQYKDYEDVEARYYTDIFVVEDTLGQIKQQVIKIGYPILWGVLSFMLLIIGIKRQWKQLRIIALALLGITIIKLFVYDINNVSETGKILAFTLLGVLILIISFVYQKIKKLVVDETENNDTQKH
ncbi:MAG: DUF2339 domain-containing protein [Aestuariibaculum sp.]